MALLIYKYKLWYTYMFHAYFKSRVVQLHSLKIEQFVVLTACTHSAVSF